MTSLEGARERLSVLFPRCTLNDRVLAQQLHYYGVNVEVRPQPRFPTPNYFKGFDVVYGIYLIGLSRIVFSAKFSGKRFVAHIVGGDVQTYVRRRDFKKRLWNLTLKMCDEVLYCSEEIKRMMALERGEVLPIPIDTKVFKKIKVDGEKRDILYYCPDARVYRLDWILQYAKEHPDETITVLWCPHPITLPNVKTIDNVPYQEMPLLYNMHHRLIRMTIYDGYPKMPYEALLCGLEVVWNGQKINQVPAEMLMENTIPKLISILKKL